MTTCREARGALLDVDLDALRPGAPGPLGAHLATCAACRAAADRIVSGTTGLAAARGSGTRRAPASVVATALERGRRLRSRQRRMRVVVPLLAAASLAVFFVSELPIGSPEWRPPVPAPLSLPPIVEAGALNVAVFSTTRPDVTVVWQF